MRSPSSTRQKKKRCLLENIKALPPTPFQFGAYESKRRVAYFGHSYDFTHQRLEKLTRYPAGYSMWLTD